MIASGLMAGGALGGVLGAAFRLFPGFTEDWIKTPFYGNECLANRLHCVVRGSVRLSVEKVAGAAQRKHDENHLKN